MAETFFRSKAAPLKYFWLGVLISWAMLGGLLLAALGHGTAMAADSQPSWTARASAYDTFPPVLVAVDKADQRLFLLERNSPPQIALEYICTTGKQTGDKLVEGDLRTPEGVYFVVRHLNSGLEFLKYGREAYTLNYPNPVDRLRRKTGHGIWIHGRGERIYPLMTEGCVALNNEDLDVLGQLLLPGTPVSMAESFLTDAPSEEQVKTAKLLIQKTHDWSNAWQDRSNSFFSFYDKDAYSIAQGEPFEAFQSQKERLFKRLAWIKSTINDVQALPGPGYWVTWFYQDYSASNLSTKGVRRLYWQQDEQGEYKIVGMEWLPGMTTNLTLASVSERLQGTGGAIQLAEGGTAPEAPGGEQAVGIAPDATPEEPVVAAAVIPAPASQEASASWNPTFTTALDHVEDPRFGKMAEPPQAAELRAGQGEVVAMSSPRGVAEPSLPELMGLPPALPSQGLGREVSTSPVVLDGSSVLIASADLTTGPTHPSGATDTREPSPATPSLSSGASAQGLSGQESDRKIPERAASVGVDDSGILAFVEDWRRAWESGDVDSYMSFYAPAAIQGGRTSAESIRSHKNRVWKKAAPAAVRLSQMNVDSSGPIVTVSMLQEYTDTAGSGDKGTKKLDLERFGQSWRIVGETWSAVP